MSWVRFFRRARWDDERRQELEDYLAHEIDDNLARGMSLDDATREAHRRLGNPTLIREEIYRMNTLRLVDSFWQDLRFGARLLLKNPTFSCAAILTLALGTGAHAAIFQLVNSLRLRALPVERPHELVSIRIDTHDTGRIGRFLNRRPYFSEPLWRAIEAQSQVFAGTLAFGITNWNLATDGESRPARGLYVSGGFFETLGIRAEVGRLLTPADDRTGCGNPGAVLTHGFWQSRYGGDRAVVGRTIALDNRPVEIIGVTPPDFFGVEVGRTYDVALPLCAEPIFQGTASGVGRADVWFLDIIARLAPGVTLEQARANLAAVSPGVFDATVPAGYSAENARAYRAFTFDLAPAATGVSALRTTYATQLWVLLAATSLVLLVTCANLANLLLARATAREREIGVRLAIGASRGRVIRQMLSESFLLAGLGAAGGTLLATWLSRWLVVFLSSADNPLFLDLAPDWRLFGFMAALAALTCVLFGLSPALKATTADPGQSIQPGGRSNSDSRERFTLRRTLVVVQVALSMVLIIGAVLFARSLDNLLTVDPGFRTDGVMTLRIDTRRAAVPPEARASTYTAILERLRAVPGVQFAAETAIVPLSGGMWNQSVIVDGVKRDEYVLLNSVGTDFFRALGTTLVAGRPFGAEDRAGTPEVAIVNERFARKYFGNASPIGRTFQLEAVLGESQPRFTVVGVIRDMKYYELREVVEPGAFFPAAQETSFGTVLNVLVTSDLPTSSLAPGLTQAVRSVVPGATVAYDTMNRFLRDSTVTERLMASLSGFLGGLAMLIATIGLYGVMSYTVMRRKVEIGIRIALGATPRSVVGMVLGESGALLLFGMVTGIALALAAARWSATLLYDLEPGDPLSIAIAAAALGLVGLLAAWIPARRASRLAPTIALRAE